MAIPGYTPTSASSVDLYNAYTIYGPGANASLLNNLASSLGISTSDVASLIDEMVKRADASNYPMLLDEDGKLDMGLLYPGKQVPAPWQQLDVVGKPDGKTFILLIVQGRWTLFCSKEAVDFIFAQLAQEIPVEIPPPEIRIVSLDGFVGFYEDSRLFNLSIVATFMTKFGETEASNVATTSPMSSFSSVTVELTKPPHSLVTHVRYYMSRGDSFRLMKEIKWDTLQQQ